MKSLFILAGWKDIQQRKILLSDNYMYMKKESEIDNN